MKNNKSILLLFCILICAVSCKKEVPIHPEIPRDYYIGTYYGNKTCSQGIWPNVYIIISESLKGDSYVTIKGLTGSSYHDLEAVIKNNKLIINDQSFTVFGYSPGGSQWEYLSIWNGLGVLDTLKNEIKFNYREVRFHSSTTYTYDWITVGQKQ
ncbi:hypothetical protein ACFLQ5_03065 [Bacteroidota bacterium]